MNARFPSTCAPLGMVTADVAPPGVGAGEGAGEGIEDGDDGDELLPQASAASETTAASVSRIGVIGGL